MPSVILVMPPASRLGNTASRYAILVGAAAGNKVDDHFAQPGCLSRLSQCYALPCRPSISRNRLTTR